MTQTNDCTGLLLDLLTTQRTKPETELIIGVTSAVRKEGRTSLACSLAETLALQMDRSTVLMELDFERPTLAARYDIESKPGLAELVLDSIDPSVALQKVQPKLAIFSTGNLVDDQSLKLSALLLEKGLPMPHLRYALGSGFIVILDLPPLLDSPLGLRMAGLASHLVLAVRADSTSSATIKEAIETLEEGHYRSRLSHNVLMGSRSRIPRWLQKLGVG